jgi:hypothetical protein
VHWSRVAEDSPYADAIGQESDVEHAALGRMDGVDEISRAILPPGEASECPKAAMWSPMPMADTPSLICRFGPLIPPRASSARGLECNPYDGHGRGMQFAAQLTVMTAIGESLHA